jgi:hypothetical protein
MNKVSMEGRKKEREINSTQWEKKRNDSK